MTSYLEIRRTFLMKKDVVYFANKTCVSSTNILPCKHLFINEAEIDKVLAALINLREAFI